jgi:hypothetical protein
METKPYDLQSPEQIAKDYGGNKQKIAEAMQMGIIDPTAGTIAGMFIDRMRAAAQTEQTSQQTVAQQIFNPPAPPAGGIGMPPTPDGASAGLGATPEAAQMQAAMPEMGAPQMAPPQMAPPQMAPPQMAPPEMAMAGGGIASLPIPDTMFDGPDDGSYADGGIVAFAAGGETDGERQERLIRAAVPGVIVTSRQRSAADNALVGGVPNSFHKTDQARDFAPPPGMSMAEFDKRVKGILGQGTDVINEGNHIHTEPGGKRAAPTPREADTSTAGGRAMALEDQLGFADRLFAGLPREAMDLGKKTALEDLDPAKIKKQEKLGQAAALTAAGFALMGETGPLGSSIAKAGATYMASLEGSKKEQKAAKNEAIRNLMAYEELDRKTAIAALGFGMDAYKLGLTADQQQRVLDFEKVKLVNSIQQAGYDRASAEKIAGMRTSNPTQFESMMEIVLGNDIEKKAALEKVIGLQKPQTGMVLPGMEGVAGGAGDVNSGMSIVGSRPV